MPIFCPRLMFVAFIVDSLLSFALLFFRFLSCPLFSSFHLLFLLLCSNSLDSSFSSSPFVLPFMFLFFSFSYFCVLPLFVIFLQNKYFFLCDVFCVNLYELCPKSGAVSVSVHLANLYLLNATVQEQRRAIRIR